MDRYLKRFGADDFIDGVHLLSLCQKLVREQAGQAALGAGAASAPYTMTSPAQWIARWRLSSREKLVYYKLGGRQILKDQRLYISDIGPAYLNPTSLEDGVAKATARRLVNTSRVPSTLMATANFDEAAQAGWLKRNTMDAPTYRFGAQRIVEPGLIYEDSMNSLVNAGGNKPSSWANLRNSSALARSVRLLLKGEHIPLVGAGGGYDRNYSRKQFMLPIFTMAIFHAEPARNERAWPINLMLLDLAEAAVANFTWDAIFWHPEAINPVGELVQSPLMGPAGREPNQRNMVPITETAKLHLVGGLLPASPTGGGERGKPSLFTEPRPLHAKQIERGEVQGPGSVPVIPFDYIHQKEIDVLFKWVERTTGGVWSAVPAAAPQHLRTPQDVLGTGNDVPMVFLRTKIRDRIRTFDAM